MTAKTDDNSSGNSRCVVGGMIPIVTVVKRGVVRYGHNTNAGGWVLVPAGRFLLVTRGHWYFCLLDSKGVKRAFLLISQFSGDSI